MRQCIIRNLYRSPRVVPFIRHKEPRLLEAWNRPAYGSANIVVIEIRGRKFTYKLTGSKVSLAFQVLYLPRRKRGILIIVKHRAVKLRFAALGGDADTGNSRIFSAEIVGENIKFAHSLERGL